MKIKLKLMFLYVFFVTLLFTAASPALACVPGVNCPGDNTSGGPTGTSFSIATYFSPANLFTDFGRLASAVILTLTSVAAAACFIFIIIGGIKIVTAGGDSKKLASAGSTITYAIIGLAVTILAFVILRVVQFVIGSNVPIT